MSRTGVHTDTESTRTARGEERKARPSLGRRAGGLAAPAPGKPSSRVAAVGRPRPGNRRRRQAGSGPGAHSFLPPGPEGGHRLPRWQLSLSPNSGVSARAAGPGGPAGCARVGEAARPASRPLPPHAARGRRPSAPWCLPPPRGAGPPTSAGRARGQVAAAGRAGRPGALPEAVYQLPA